MDRTIDVYWLDDGRLGAVFAEDGRPGIASSDRRFDSVNEDRFALDVVRVIERDGIAYGRLENEDSDRVII